MKTSLIVVATAVVTILLASFFNGAKTGYDQTWLISAVKVPGSMAIEAIQSDLNAGRCESAKVKVDALAQTWKRFNSGPQSFRGAGIGDIMVMFSTLDATNRITGSEPNGPANGSQPSRPDTNSTPPAAGSRR